MGLGWKYRGKTTKQLYEFLNPLLNSAGQPVTGGQNSTAVYNGEIVVIANRDGSMQRSTAGPMPDSPPNPPYSISTITSPWESNDE